MTESAEQQLCPYCHDQKPILNDDLWKVWIHNNYLIIQFKFFGNHNENYLSVRHVEYWYMCGRKLGDE